MHQRITTAGNIANKHRGAGEFILNLFSGFRYKQWLLYNCMQPRYRPHPP